MIYTSVIPCLSSGLSYFNGFFSHFESLAFFSKIGGQTLHQSSQAQQLRQVLFDIRAGSLNLAKSLGEKK